MKPIFNFRKGIKMGYYMDQTGSKFVIKKENFKNALNALKAVFVPEKMDCVDYIGGKQYPHFSWVDTQIVLNAGKLEDALVEIRYKPKYDDNGNIVNVKFTGEKYGSENVFFTALAPYVEKDSYIAFKGGDDKEWSWNFNGKTVSEIYQ